MCYDFYNTGLPCPVCLTVMCHGFPEITVHLTEEIERALVMELFNPHLF